MHPKIATTALLAMTLLLPAQQAAAQDVLGGALLGGATGAIIGGVATGKAGGAVAGGVIGAAAGAIIANEAQRRRGHYAHRGHCYAKRRDGSFVRVSNRYCR